jgi:hypothetical protein
VPKLNGSNSNLGRSRRSKPPGKFAVTIGLVFVAIFLGVSIAGFVGLVVELQYRAGWVGTPGTVSMVSCETVRSGRSEHTDCDGEFQSGDGSAPTLVSIEGNNTYASDRGYAARLHSDGQTVSVVGGKTVAYVLGGMFATLGLIVFIGWFGVAGIIGFVIRHRLGRPWRLGKRAALAPLIASGVLLVFGIVGGIVGGSLGF